MWGDLPCGLQKQEATLTEARAAAVKLLQHVPANAPEELQHALIGFATTAAKRDEAWAELLVIAGVGGKIVAATGASAQVQPQRRLNSKKAFRWRLLRRG